MANRRARGGLRSAEQLPSEGELARGVVGADGPDPRAEELRQCLDEPVVLLVVSTCFQVAVTTVNPSASSAFLRAASSAMRSAPVWQSVLSYSTATRSSGQSRSQRKCERPVTQRLRAGMGTTAFIKGCLMPLPQRRKGRVTSSASVDSRGEAEPSMMWGRAARRAFAPRTPSSFRR